MKILTEEGIDCVAHIVRARRITQSFSASISKIMGYVQSNSAFFRLRSISEAAERANIRITIPQTDVSAVFILKERLQCILFSLNMEVIHHHLVLLTEIITHR